MATSEEERVGPAVQRAIDDVEHVFDRAWLRQMALDGFVRVTKDLPEPKRRAAVQALSDMYVRKGGGVRA